jgi:uncharacterized protein (TIGR02453 family)
MLSVATIEFLQDLKENNNREWFEANKKRYLKVKEEYLGLADSLLSEMKKYDASLEMLSAKDCIFRINRDIRFSTNKSPYKTNLGIGLHPGGKKSMLATYYLHIELGQCFVGGGLWMPEAPLLSKVRKEIHYFYPDLKNIIENKDFSKSYGDLDIESGAKLVRPPKGYTVEDPAIEYLKLKSFTASAKLSDPLITSKNLIPTVVKYFQDIKPLLQFLNRGIQSDDDGGL